MQDFIFQDINYNKPPKKIEVMAGPSPAETI